MDLIFMDSTQKLQVIVTYNQNMQLPSFLCMFPSVYKGFRLFMPFC